MEYPALPASQTSKQIYSAGHCVRNDSRMYGNLFLEESVVTDLVKLEEDFTDIVKEKIKASPDNMLELNKV